MSESKAPECCTVCGGADDNLSVPFGRCWPCIMATSAAWEAKAAAHRQQDPGAAPRHLSDTERDVPRFMRDAKAAREPRWVREHLMPRQQVARRIPEPTSDPSQGTSARRFLGLLRAVNQATEGSRNATLHWAACRAGEMAAEGELMDVPRAADALAQVAVGTGLTHTETLATIRSGFSTYGVTL